MSYYISRVSPVFKNWQFQSLSEGISRADWLNLADKMETLELLENKERGHIISIQNPEFYIHIRHIESEGGAIAFSSFPQRFRDEFIKYLYQVCQHLHTNLYSLNNDGHTADKFDFSIYQNILDKEYLPLNEKKVTNVEISEMMGLMCIPDTNIISVASFLKFQEYENTTWEDAVEKCYKPDNYLIRSLKGWTIVIGQLEQLVSNFQNELDKNDTVKEQFKHLLILVSSKFGIVSYTFNASKYAFFENFIAKNGQLVYQYVHGDGQEIKEGESNEIYFKDFMAFCYDESILDGVQLYKMKNNS